MNVSVYLHVCTHTRCVQCSQRAEEGVTFPRTDIIDSCGHHACSRSQPLSGSESQCSEQLDYLSSLSTPRFSLFCIALFYFCLFCIACFFFFLVPSRIMP